MAEHPDPQAKADLGKAMQILLNRQAQDMRPKPATGVPQDD